MIKPESRRAHELVGAHGAVMHACITQTKPLVQYMSCNTNIHECVGAHGVTAEDGPQPGPPLPPTLFFSCGGSGRIWRGARCREQNLPVRSTTSAAKIPKLTVGFLSFPRLRNQNAFEKRASADACLPSLPYYEPRRNILFSIAILTERAPVSLSCSRDSTCLSRCSIIACACSALDIF